MPEPTGTMRAITQRAYGSADTFTLEQVPVPVIADDEVLVRVHAAGLDRGTWHLMVGRPYALRLALGLRAPRNPVPGIDVAGTVSAVGPAVTRFAVGDQVYGMSRGAFAEYAAVPERKLARKPANLGFEQAAVVPISGGTALQALAAGQVTAGQHVLVVGASGGVGSYAVQLAKASGAEVTGVCSAAKAEYVRSLGADHVLDHARDDFAAGTRRYDVILDIGGNPTLRRLRRALTPTGTAVIVGGESGGEPTGGLNRNLRAVVWSPFLRRRLTGLISKERAADTQRLTELIEAGEVTPSVDRVYPLEAVPDAMRRLEAGEVRGKLAIRV